MCVILHVSFEIMCTYLYISMLYQSMYNVYFQSNSKEYHHRQCQQLAPLNECNICLQFKHEFQEIHFRFVRSEYYDMRFQVDAI